ncbi:MAG: hypothetical protein J3K34DRAFT_437678 [Monoraphidium minutum]|nr:MAG: hypothetical protein J3K34DRAFT_437678 [Monoraphidium minutum]
MRLMNMRLFSGHWRHPAKAEPAALLNLHAATPAHGLVQNPSAALATHRMRPSSPSLCLSAPARAPHWRCHSAPTSSLLRAEAYPYVSTQRSGHCCAHVATRPWLRRFAPPPAHLPLAPPCVTAAPARAPRGAARRVPPTVHASERHSFGASLPNSKHGFHPGACGPRRPCSC